ncbi:hypothetical protein AB8A21_09690 [Streptomyces sp. BF23-18]|uniref:hypothetical protein n=1 Tax=Streptomyces sp. BF23-18 TaxID=3240282 RepID=UPI0034E3D41C
MKRTTVAIPRTSQPAQTDRKHGEPRLTIRDAGLFIAGAAYEEALLTADPVVTLDRICTTAAEVMPNVVKTVDAKSGGAIGEPLRAATLAPLLAFAAIERASAEAGPAHRYAFDYLARSLHAGADPRAIRKAAEEMPRQLRDGRPSELVDDQARA